VQRIGSVESPGMFRPHIASSHDLQPCRVERSEQFRPRPQAEVLREIRKDQPALSPWRQVRGQCAQEAAQHAAVGVIDPPLERRARPRGNPGRVAYHQRGPSLREQIRQHDFRLLGEPKAIKVLASTRQRAGILIRRDYAPDAAPREHGGQHTRSGADVEGQAGG